MSEAGGGDPETAIEQGPDSGGFLGSDEERWGLVLTLLLGGYLAGTLVRSPAVRFTLDVLVIGLVLAAVHRGEGVPRWLRLLSTAATGTVVGLTVVDEITTNHVVRGIQALAASLVFATVLLAILLRLLRSRVITLSTVLGAVDAYVLIGFTFCWIYVAVYELGGAFFAQGGPSNLSDFIYFSLITLTTVGFGDLTAGTQTARSLVAIEAVLGQVMLVTLVARLVGLMGQEREPPMELPRPTIRRRNRPGVPDPSGEPRPPGDP